MVGQRESLGEGWPNLAIRHQRVSTGSCFEAQLPRRAQPCAWADFDLSDEDPRRGRAGVAGEAETPPSGLKPGQGTPSRDPWSRTRDREQGLGPSGQGPGRPPGAVAAAAASPAGPVGAGARAGPCPHQAPPRAVRDKTWGTSPAAPSQGCARAGGSARQGTQLRAATPGKYSGSPSPSCCQRPLRSGERRGSAQGSVSGAGCGREGPSRGPGTGWRITWRGVRGLWGSAERVALTHFPQGRRGGPASPSLEAPVGTHGGTRSLGCRARFPPAGTLRIPALSSLSNPHGTGSGAGDPRSGCWRP